MVWVFIFLSEYLDFPQISLLYKEFNLTYSRFYQEFICC